MTRVRVALAGALVAAVAGPMLTGVASATCITADDTLETATVCVAIDTP